MNDLITIIRWWIDWTRLRSMEQKEMKKIKFASSVHYKWLSRNHGPWATFIVFNNGGTKMFFFFGVQKKMKEIQRESQHVLMWCHRNIQCQSQRYSIFLTTIDHGYYPHHLHSPLGKQNNNYKKRTYFCIQSQSHYYYRWKFPLNIFNVFKFNILFYALK